MIEKENLGTFLKDNKKLIRDYLDTRLEIFKFKLIRIFSKSTGYLIWVIISLFLFSLLMNFIGLVIGFWLTKITGSYVEGFGYTSLIMLAVIILLALFRKALFINPIIRLMIRRSTENNHEMNPDQ
jgi:ABC-type protease/lipase transport system fused ATPase/permease subunit